jgi:dipeptidyl aminopeptidase/acylaminoacyl peptidase
VTETVTHAPHRPLSRALPLSHAATPLAAFPTRAHPRQRLLAWIIGLLAAGCLTAHAGPLATPSHTAGKLLTPSHVAMLRSVSAAVISPDGKQVAYTLVVPRKPLDEEDGRAWSELHVVDAKGHSRPFVTGAVNVRHIRWTPDGRAMTFIAQRGDDKHDTLYTIPVDGGEARALIAIDADVRGFALRQDGQRVAVLACEPIDKSEQEYRDKGFNQEIFEEDWRPTQVWLAPTDGSTSPQPLDLPGSASLVEWSPSGRQLAVVLAPTPLVDDSYMAKHVYLVDADTQKVVRRFSHSAKLGQLTWSPDGKHLAMIAGVDLHDPSAGRLMVTTTVGDATPRDLMPDAKVHVDSFAWQDDRTLLWVAAEGTATTIGTVDLSGDRHVKVAAGGPIATDITLSDDGRTAAVLGHSARHSLEVFLLPQGAKAARRLTCSNPWLAKMRFARQEAIEWQARDGLRLEGILIYPINYQKGRRYPLIMAVHGGPESHVSNGWVTSYSRPGQVATARGFAVFYPNYRGSTGRGVKFSKLGQADAAGKEFDDLVDGVDHLIATGLVAKDKVGITGGSYGGYASAWGATYYSDRFAASVMFVGISDDISKMGTTDIPEEMFLVHHRKRLWDDWDYFLERSPIRHVQKNRTPTLILHGKNDPRVHPSQSLELHRHLKTLDQAPVRLVLYPGEGHGNRRAASRFDYNLRMLRWMEHYLQGPADDPPPRQIDYAKQLERP